MNVMLGNETAIEGYKKPLDPEDYTHEQLIAKAEKIGISTKLEPMKADSAECPDDLLFARLNDLVYKRRVPGRRVTVMTINEEKLDVAFRVVSDPGGIWDNHAMKGTKPTWVESDNPELAKMLADKWGIPIGRPAGWVETFKD